MDGDPMTAPAWLVDASPRSFAEYVGRRLAEGRVSMRGRRS